MDLENIKAEMDLENIKAVLRNISENINNFRYGKIRMFMTAYLKPPKKQNAVRVTSADFNGYDFDESPFSHYAEWIVDAIKAQTITISDKHRGLDYAVFKVQTKNGTSIAEPGDYIIFRNDSLSVIDGERYMVYECL